jgi:hypothetical protein
LGNGTGARRPSSAVVVAVVAALAATAFAVFGGVGLAKSGPGKANAAQGQYGKKVEVCHKGKKTLKVSVHAWPAHKRHGDAAGTCAELKAKKLKAKQLKAEKLAAKQAKQAKQAKHEDDEDGDDPASEQGHGKGKGKSKEHGKNH